MTDTLKCPHCHHAIHVNWGQFWSGEDADFDGISLHVATCPGCGRLLVRLEQWHTGAGSDDSILYPVLTTREIPAEVTGEYRDDFEQACRVLPISPKASAALSRSLLQHILREKGGVKRSSLNDEIDEIIVKNVLPADLADDLDAVRTVGNFASHPIKSTSTGSVVPVEPGEAEWLLDLVEELLDFYFVRPTVRKQKRDSLDAKLADADKPGLKGSEPAVPGSGAAEVPVEGR